jgi:hydrogenase nickel incorporation protein HypA/HybF
MHELAIAQGVVDAIVQRLGPASVTAVTLRIGKVSGVVPDAVRFCFDLAAEGTPVQGAALTITEPPGRARCRSCSADFPVEDLLLLCRCGSVDVELLSGQELDICSVEVA